jgi:hypothetical protein
LSDLLSAVEGALNGGNAGDAGGGGHKKDKGGATTVYVTKTVGGTAVGSGKNGTIAANGKTVTVTETQVAATAAGTGNAYVDCKFGDHLLIYSAMSNYPSSRKHSTPLE